MLSCLTHLYFRRHGIRELPPEPNSHTHGKNLADLPEQHAQRTRMGVGCTLRKVGGGAIINGTSEAAAPNAAAGGDMKAI